MADIAKLTADVVKAAMRFYNYRERYTEMQQFTRGGELHRLAPDSVWGKLGELEQEREAACARLAAARRKARSSSTTARGK